MKFNDIKKEDLPEMLKAWGFSEPIIAVEPIGKDEKFLLATVTLSVAYKKGTDFRQALLDKLGAIQ